MKKIKLITSAVLSLGVLSSSIFYFNGNSAEAEASTNSKSAKTQTVTTNKQKQTSVKTITTASTSPKKEVSQLKTEKKPTSTPKTTLSLKVENKGTNQPVQNKQTVQSAKSVTTVKAVHKTATVSTKPVAATVKTANRDNTKVQTTSNTAKPKIITQSPSTPKVVSKPSSNTFTKLTIESKFYVMSQQDSDTKTGYVALVGEVGKNKNQFPRYYEYNKDGYQGTLSITQVYLTPDTQNETDPAKQKFYSYYQGTIKKVVK
ncbi:hypothetical protein [Heyndrickxia camelliae]|uniref:Uncharacterized protein n=1 Tax=Heyndrickxia camelliae TaxID=1707093 RepID=A0A2N3LEK8_9BACI|nr:hypothetical protein [Heyndrickxia camelliae]PKR83029.1 hypothetical protein CWO92_21050 [Heyndrickxia camelliae]